MGRKLYKFGSFNEFTRDIIITEEFFFSDWEKMNDPMEGLFQYYKEEHSQNEIDALYSEKNKYGISCFSKDYSEILMWSHYADNHNGVCIEVEIDDELCDKNSIIVKDVEYATNVQMLLSNDGTTPYSIELLSKKITKWKYEKEVRVFCNKKNSLHKIGKIKNILIKKGSTKMDLIKQYILNKDIKVIEVELNFDKNKIDIVKENISENDA